MLAAAAAAPTVSRLIRHLDPEAAIMAAVCVMPGDHGGQPGSTGMGGVDCPMCLSAAQGVDPQPPAPLVVRAPVLADAVPALFLHAPRPLFAWASAQPRAPPTAG